MAEGEITIKQLDADGKIPEVKLLFLLLFNLYIATNNIIFELVFGNFCKKQ